MDFDYVGLVAALAAATGLFFTAIQLRSTNKTHQLELLETIVKDTHSLEQLFYEKYIDKSENEKKNWRQLFFQQLEWFAYLVNHKNIKDKELIKFFKKPFVRWSEDLFAVHADDDQLKNPERFEEFKKLYATFTGKSIQRQS
ncbi:MAG: hypothetical protein OEM89_10825 [Nitrosopumilus sp.]|nr:hypothetical protein [Nitrosopumilus sp.]